VTGYEGAPMEVTSGQVVATNGRIHDTLVAELSALRV
jgi:hypothetical protein